MFVRHNVSHVTRRAMMQSSGIALATGVFVPPVAMASEAASAPTSSGSTTLAVDDFAFASAFDGTEPLYATAVYPVGQRHLPVMIVQHGYDGNRTLVGYSARRMAERGFFSLCVQTRGWGGELIRNGKPAGSTEKSAGKHDAGGVETMDIHDGLQAAIRKYGQRIDASRVSIIGYSYGGGMVYLATVRFPFQYRAAMACFGIPDYRLHVQLREQRTGRKATRICNAIGARPEDQPDLYLARSAILAAGNLSGTRFHIAHDEEETICPLPNVYRFIEEVRKHEYRNLFVHESRKTDSQRWLHGYNFIDNPVPAKNQRLSPVEDRFMDDIENSGAVAPEMPEVGELTVIGHIITPRFSCVAGHGNDAVARLSYDCRRGAARFAFTPLTSRRDAAVELTLAGDLAEDEVRVTVDHEPRIVSKIRHPLKINCRLDSTVLITSTRRRTEVPAEPD